MTTEANAEKRGIPYVKRLTILALVILGAVLGFGPLTIFHPIKPPVFIMPELIGMIGPVEIRNSMIGVLVADLVLILFGLVVWNFMRRGNEVPSGFYNFLEAMIGYFWNLTQQVVGQKFAKRVFPLIITIFLFVLSANVTKLLPGFEAIGWFQQVHLPSVQGYAPYTIIPGFLYALDAGEKQNYEDIPQGDGAHGVCEFGCEVIPFLRAPATDLNFTLAIALVTMVLIQFWGFQANGIGYLGKFFQLDGLRKLLKPKFEFQGVFFGLIFLFVGFLELISEFVKIVSFSFRLFGAIFAGTLLFTVLGTLVPVLVPVGVYGLELFVGFLQAVVFALLAVVFASLALVSHHGDDDHAH